MNRIKIETDKILIDINVDNNYEDINLAIRMLKNSIEHLSSLVVSDYDDEISKQQLDAIRRMTDHDGKKEKRRAPLYTTVPH